MKYLATETDRKALFQALWPSFKTIPRTPRPTRQALCSAAVTHILTELEAGNPAYLPLLHSLMNPTPNPVSPSNTST